jgi:hypothetical protein
MPDLEDDAIKIAKYLYKNRHIVGNVIVVGELRKAGRISGGNFDLADHYLLSTKYCGGTMGGDRGYRWLTPAGVEYVTARLAAKKRWSKGDIIAIVGVLITVIAIVVSLTIPEVRKWLGLP